MDQLMKIEIKQVKAENSREKKTETARYVIKYGIHTYETLEMFCYAHQLNSRLTSRRLNAFIQKHGSLENITFADLNSKNDRRITIDGRSYVSIKEYLDSQGLSGAETRQIFNRNKRKLHRNGSYASTKDSQLIKLAVEITKKELNK